MTKYQLRADGTFDVLDGRRVVFKNARASVSFHFADDASRVAQTNALRDAVTLTGQEENISLEARFNGDAVQLRVKNHGAAPILLDELTVLDGDSTRGGEVRLAPARDLMYLHHGWQSWSPTAVRRMTEVERAYQGDDYFEKHLPYGAAAENERTSNAFMLLAKARDDANALLLGFTGEVSQFTQIRCTVMERVMRVRAIAFADGVALEPGAVLESEVLMISFGAAGALYDAYARRVAETMGRRGTRATLQGWCSWYYYFNLVTAHDIRSNLDAIQAQRLPLDVVIVDDGYATAVGDWTHGDAETFPDGMKQIADEIHAAGKLAGIWLAPFGVQADSQSAQQHPEFLLRDENDATVHAWTHWGNQICALDLTRTDAQEWLGALIHTICHEWGYDVLKLDFLFAGALPGKRADASCTRAQAYRRGLETIARAAGDSKILMGCGAPMVASVGLVDTMRVSQDVNIVWEPMEAENGGAPSTRLAVQNTLLRAPLNQKWWLNDGDCVMVRERGDVNLLTRHERRTLASVAALTGSVVLDSDKVPNLKTQALSDLRRVLPAIENTAQVREWFANADSQPSQFALALEDGAWVLGAINWDERARVTEIALPGDKKFRVYDFWSKKDLGMHRKRVKIARHARHATIVLHCVPLGDKRKPALVHIARV
jgi:alpha-galactosidase